MAVTVSAPTAGRLLVQKITDYRLHMVASRRYLRTHPQIDTVGDLRHHRMIGYIPDMIFDRELDYLDDIGIERVALSSNSVSVQLRQVSQGSGLCVAHDFSIPFHRNLRRVLDDEISLTRAFYLVRHQGDRRSERLNRVADALCAGIRAEVSRLEGRDDDPG